MIGVNERCAERTPPASSTLRRKRLAKRRRLHVALRTKTGCRWCVGAVPSVRESLTAYLAAVY